MGIYRGQYLEVKRAVVEHDGDYLQGKLVVRVVANGFDNVRDFDYPGMEGMLVVGKTQAEYDSALRIIRREIRSDLITIFKFPTEVVENMAIPLIETKN